MKQITGEDISSEAPPSLAWWSGTLQTFLTIDPHMITGRLASAAIATYRTNENKEADAWARTIDILRQTIAQFPLHWRILLEYPLIRLGRRLDSVLVTDRAIVVIEFKTLTQGFGKSARIQAEDYAFDLRDFHAASKNHVIVPIVVAEHGEGSRPQWGFPWPGVSNVYEATPDTLSGLLSQILSRIPHRDIDIDKWEHAPYRPVPSILEAARALYQKHDVSDIRMARADTKNLQATTAVIRAAIAEAQETQKFIIVFVTGTPGAGKTLCGLDAVFSSSIDATFLTGTLPMVYVIKAALVEDAVKRTNRSKRAPQQETKSKIQSITHFVKYYNLKKAELPEHVIVFDEAQRAWDANYGKNSAFKLADSEAGIVLDIMHRHLDYAVIVGLVGNGQEINKGEAGLAEWGNALKLRPFWEIRAAPDVLAVEKEPRARLFPKQPLGMTLDDRLHLSEQIRNVDTPSAAPWVDAVLRGDLPKAQAIATSKIPFFLTRSLADMRQGLRALARGKRRSGLVCSSGAKRLVADGIWPNFEHTNESNVANWFLRSWTNDRDVRASDSLEIPATEFACQGLELDYVGLCWGGDLTWASKWIVRKFRGARWTTARDQNIIDFQINTYRVLMTRSRSTTIIWVPPGDAADPTREPHLFDQTASFLLACGASPLTTLIDEQTKHPEPTLF